LLNVRAFVYGLNRFKGEYIFFAAGTEPRDSVEVSGPRFGRPVLARELSPSGPKSRGRINIERNACPNAAQFLLSSHPIPIQFRPDLFVDYCKLPTPIIEFESTMKKWMNG
jgi:hypothetical protein